ncbi:hypothetical protein D9M72_532210 [compost metagenome]
MAKLMTAARTASGNESSRAQPDVARKSRATGSACLNARKSFTPPTIPCRAESRGPKYCPTIGVSENDGALNGGSPPADQRESRKVFRT